MKRIDIFDRLNNTIGNHMEGKATDQDLIKMAYEVDKYLLKHPHPHDLIKNNVGLSNVVGRSEQLPPTCIDGFDDDKFCDRSGECEWCKDIRR